MKVLVADDDDFLVDVICYVLRRSGYETVVAGNGAQALSKLQEEPVDLILLDIGLPQVDGFAVCQHIRREGPTPIIMLTARDDDQSVVQALGLGADDYLRKPFSLRELCARIDAVVRRCQRNRYKRPATRVELGGLSLDLESHEVLLDGKRVELTQTEFRLLYILVLNEGRVVPYARLIQFAWGHDGPGVSVVKTHVSHIRAKLGAGTPYAAAIRAVPTVGYSYRRP